MSQRLARIALWSGLGAALVATGYLLLNTTFMGYDDEGFALISLRNYLAGLRLYDDVFSQYGPWPYVYHQLVTTLGGNAPLTHMLGRALTLTHWVVMTLLCGAIGWRLTRSHLAAAAAAVIAFGLTWQMTSEPSHPGSLISMLVAFAGLLMVMLPEAKRPGLVYAGLGVIAALLLLTKINVGLLLTSGVGCYLLRYLPWPGRGRLLGWIGTAGLLALPWVLVGSQLHRPWVPIFAAQFTLAAACLLWLTPPTGLAARPPLRAWWATPLAAVVTVLAVCGWVMLRGTTLTALVETVLINPLQMPGKFIVGLTWYAECWPLTLASAGLTLAAGWELRQGRPLRPVLLWLVIAARAGVLVAFTLHLKEWPSYAGVFHFIGDCLPLLPLFLLPLEERPAPERLARWGVAYVALTQVLHAFPVAGSQLGWATFLCIPLLVAGLWDAGAVLPRLAGTAGRRGAQAGAITLVAACCGLLGLLAQTGWQRYSTSRPLDLPGAGDIRLNGVARQSARLMVLNARIHADILFSRQGMYSYNLWSGVPTPTAQNATHWFWLLTEARQRDIIARLQGTAQTAVITSPALDEFLVRQKVSVTGPLQEYIQRWYRPLFEYGGAVFNVPAGSEAVVFGRCELFQSTDPAHPPLLFRSNVLLDGRPDSIRLELIDPPWNQGPELLAGRSLAVAEPIDRQGRTLGAPIRLPASGPLRGLYRLSVYCEPLPPGFPWQSSALVVRDAEGARLSESMN